MDLNDVQESFAKKRVSPGGRERHSISSLSKRTLLSRQTLRKVLADGTIKFSARFSAPQGESFEFSSQYLDTVRSEVVGELINEFEARMAPLALTEQERVMGALQTLQAHEADIKFSASKANDDDEDPKVSREVARILGGVAGGVGGTLAHREVLRRGGYRRAGQDALDAIEDLATGNTSRPRRDSLQAAAATVGKGVAQGSKIIRSRMLDALKRAAAKM